MVVRILVWTLFDSKTTIEELLHALPELDPPSTWIWSEASERFGLVALGDDIPESEIARVAALIGAEPEVYEEFDAV